MLHKEFEFNISVFCPNKNKFATDCGGIAEHRRKKT